MVGPLAPPPQSSSAASSPPSPCASVAFDGGSLLRHTSLVIREIIIRRVTFEPIPPGEPANCAAGNRTATETSHGLLPPFPQQRRGRVHCHAFSGSTTEPEFPVDFPVIFPGKRNPRAVPALSRVFPRNRDFSRGIEKTPAQQIVRIFSRAFFPRHLPFPRIFPVQKVSRAKRRISQVYLTPRNVLLWIVWTPNFPVGYPDLFWGPF